jgi:alanyl-tRNA synthetase
MRQDWSLLEDGMSTQTLYFTDPYCFEFEAQLIEQIPLSDGRFGVILERSYFYPTGGGQEHDLGWLDEERVVDVYKDEGRHLTVHVVERRLPEGRLQARIDAERRLRHMEHHTAQHLLSYCFVELLGLETVSANINGDTPSTLDLSNSEPTSAELTQVEKRANQLIRSDLIVKAYFVSPQQVSAIPLRKPPKVSEDIRIVEIEGLDFSACGGTHVARTGGIGVVKILRAERLKEKTRIHFVAGSRAFELFQSSYAIVAGLAAQMSVGLLELPAAVQRQMDQLKNLQRELTQLKDQALAHEARRLYETAERLGNLRIILAAFDGRSMNELRALGRELRLLPNVAAVLVGAQGERVSLVTACAEGVGLRADDLLRRLTSRINGKGGGDAFIAQGGGAGDLTKAQSLIEAARLELSTPESS